MTIVSCHECKTQISTEAKQCPSCGAPVKKKTSLFTWIVAGVFSATIATCISRKQDEPPASTGIVETPTPPVSNVKNSPSSDPVVTTYPPIPDGEKDWSVYSTSTDKNDKKIVSEIGRMQWWDVCRRWGSELRSKSKTNRAAIYRSNLIHERLINSHDALYVRDKSVQIGMTECGVYAAIGFPQSINRTETAYTKRAQLVYGMHKYIYIETHGGATLVTSMQY